MALALALVTAASAAAAGPRAGEAAATFTARGSVEQVYVLGLGPRQRMTLLNSAGRRIATQRADTLGGLIFRNVKPGPAVTVRIWLSTSPAPSASG